MGASTIAILLLGIVPLDKPTIDQVDVIEHNRFFDDQGKPVFEQLVFWDWNKYAHRFEIRDWRLIKSPTQLPLKDARGSYQAMWHDGQVLRQVRAHRVTESWTQVDPELVDREMLPKEQRRGLTKAILQGDR